MLFRSEEEVERQRQILEQLERERAATSGGRRIPPPPPPPEYYILDPSDEDAPTAPGPSRWHGGDAGQGPSNAGGSGPDDDDDGGDYTVFYSQLGM